MMNTITRKILINTRLVAVLFLGFAAGMPLVLTGATLQAWFTEASVNLATIGAISLIGVPYTLKFLWAPIMDYISVPWIGMRRGWILVMQVGLVLTLWLLAGMNPTADATGMFGLAVCIAFFSASQDVAIDAYRTDVLQENERGLGAAYYVFAYRVATLVSGGLALIVADHVGWKITYEIMAIVMAISMAATFFAPRVAEIKKTTSFFATTLAGLTDLINREKVVYLVLFLLLYKIGDALASQLMTNFLLHGLGFTLTEVGLAYKSVSLVATVSGAFVGGLFLTRWDVYRALLVFGLAQAFSNLMFVMLALVGKQFIFMMSAIFIENFCSGLSTAALMAFMMSLCHRQFTASQFALLSAVVSLGRVFLGPVAAQMVNSVGWVEFYTWAFVLSFPGIIFLVLLKKEIRAYAFNPAG